MENYVEMRDTVFISGGRKRVILLECPQVLLVRRSDKGSMRKGGVVVESGILKQGEQNLFSLSENLE
jgi:hypothetical protein